MRSIRLTSLCLVVASAIGALAASPASALPEFGRCVPVTAPTGNHSNAQCIGPAGPPAGRVFKWEKTVPEPRFTSSGGVAELQTESGTKIVCASESANGELKAAASITQVQHVVATFQGCELPIFATTCQTAAHASGEIVTTMLKGPVHRINALAKEVGLLLRPEVLTGPFAEFECGPVGKVKIGKGPRGGNNGVIAPITPVDEMQPSEVLTYSYESTPTVAQKPQKFELPLTLYNLEAKLGEGPFERAGLALTTTITWLEPGGVELKQQ